MHCIEINNLSKDYGDGNGIFNISADIAKGEVYGFAGTNGSGKTTTIRHLMGFSKADSGSVRVNDLDCWKQADQVKKFVGYVPGEIAFPDAKTGYDFLKQQAYVLGLKDLNYAEKIIDLLQLEPTAILKRMSKGMKQKTAITAAFMADPEIIILDEPSTGLDPLMRVAFMELLNEEKKKGKTIFISSHLFDELEDVCDRVAFIDSGKIVAELKTDVIKYQSDKTFKIEFLEYSDYRQFMNSYARIVEDRGTKNQVLVRVHDSEINSFFHLLKKFKVKFLKQNKYSIEEYFKSIYSGGTVQ